MVKFNPLTDVPPLGGKVAIVTGGNRGMGFQLMQQLAIHGAKVYMAARSEGAAKEAIARIESEMPEHGGKVLFLHLDLGTIKGADAAARRFLETESRLDILIHNAALMSHNYARTADDLEDSLAVNHLAPFAFTQVLLSLLVATPKIPQSDVRVSSSVHTLAPRGGKFSTKEEINNTLSWSPLTTNSIFARYARYGRSKLILFAMELRTRFASSSSSPALSIALHPGCVATETVLASMHAVPIIGPLMRFAVSRLAMSPLDGAATALFAATPPVVRERAGEFAGAYLVPYGEIAGAGDGLHARRLWEASEELVREILRKP
ncbi:NAD(P)-binding protein [Neolentinus lepideus HHB14362 ss-1]|uniref:NAD(P)-binding protein n=1 Tax=Neolentinus lepideus HHB14362 ss-1 TaxID=1314782 RepID=A0A165UUK0_9AGAM|nr:NAD(P)-binding protein [Neolentinus lepideus HHB14362 ss-1]